MSRLGQTVKVRGSAGGEGDWWWSVACGFVDMDLAYADRVLIWADEEPTITSGSGTLIAVAMTGMWVFDCTGAGTIRLSAGSIVAHRPIGGFIESICA